MKHIMHSVVFLSVGVWLFCLSGCQPSTDRQQILEGNNIELSSGTDAGMHGLWNPQGFEKLIKDEADWEREFIPDGDQVKLNSIAQGLFVPIYLEGDGGINVQIKIGTSNAPAALNAEQKKYQWRESEEYLFVSNGVVKLSGIEYIGPNSESIPGVKLSPGRWAVKVYFLKYPEEIKRGPVLSEFIVTMNPESNPSKTYRNNVNTWDQSIW